MAAGEIYSATLWCILDKVCKKTIDPGIIFKLLRYNLKYMSMISRLLRLRIDFTKNLVDEKYTIETKNKYFNVNAFY